MYSCKININNSGKKYDCGCNYILYENNKIVGKSDINFQNIIDNGNGLFCFWT